MTFDDGTTWNCDQNFAPVALRYQYQYRFFDTWNNLANVPAYMNEYQVRYKDSSYVRVGQTWPSGKTVDWTNQLVQNNYAVPAYSSMEVLSTFTNDWAVLNHPVVRTGNDFTIGYQIGYDFSNNYPDASDDIKHVECQPYYITWCGDGIVDTNYETCDPAAPGQSPSTCDVVTCQPITTPPTPVVSIKKYAKEISAIGDTQTTPIAIARGEVFNYYYQLQNTGSVAATGVVVKDTLPAYLTYLGAITVMSPTGADVSTDWTCTKGSQIFPGETVTRITLVCSKKTDLPANSGLYTFSVPVVLATYAPVNINMQNVVYVCADNVVANPTGPNGEVICGNVNPPPPPPPAQCDQTNPNSQKDPACIVVTGIGFDLSLKKYIGTNDAQTAALGVSTTTNAPLNYIIRVTNSGPVSSSGTTTVQDILPVGVAIDGTASGSSWSCSISGVTIKCTSSLVVASGSSYPDITVPFRVTATTGQTVTNIAAVDNPLEVNRCMADGSALPATAGGICTRDVNNSDPAVLYIPGGGGGGASHV